MAIFSPLDLWRVAKRVDRLFAFEKAVDETFAKVEARLARLEERVIRMEVAQGQVLTEAKAAAAAAATTAAGSVAMAGWADVITRLTRVEIRLEGSGPLPLPPPEAA